MRLARRYGLLAAIGLTLLYSCPGTGQSADTNPVVSNSPDTKHGIDGPNESVPGDMCVFDANVPKDATVAWKIDPPEAGARFRVDTGGKRAYFASSVPGRYVIFLAVASDGKATAYAHVLNQGQPGPEPGPEPEPEPDPGPDPEPGRRFVLLVSETENRPTSVGIMLQGVKNYITGRHEWRESDPDDTAAKTGETSTWLQGYLKRIKDAKLDATDPATPVIVIGVYAQNSRDITKLYIDPLPATAAAAITLIKKRGG